jgi:hypothetical protein
LVRRVVFEGAGFGGQGSGLDTADNGQLTTGNVSLMMLDRNEQS